MSEKLKKHPNVLQIMGLCPDFKSPLFAGVGTTAQITPLQENGGLREFFDKRAWFQFSDGHVVVEHSMSRDFFQSAQSANSKAYSASKC